MKFPATYIELVNGGYMYLSRKRCQACGDDVVLFRTPKGKLAPFVLLQSGKYLSHFATCRYARRAQHEAAKSVEQRSFKELTCVAAQESRG